MSKMIALGVVFVAMAALGMSMCGEVSLRPEACLKRLARAPSGRFAAITSEDASVVVLEYEDKTRLRVAKKPRKIISTLPGITEMIAYLGALDRLHAVTPNCTEPPQVLSLPTIRVHPTIDIEEMVRHEPDLVVVDGNLSAADVQIVGEYVSNVLVLHTSRSLQDLRTSMDLLARVLGDDTARTKAQEWIERSRALESRLQRERPAKPMQVLIAAAWDPLYVLGPKSLLSDLVRACGAINVACDLKGGDSNTFSEELVMKRAPDWILTTNEAMPDNLRERWKNVPAVKTRQLGDVSADILVRGGPRILDGLEDLQHMLLTEPDEAR